MIILYVIKIKSVGTVQNIIYKLEEWLLNRKMRKEKQ